MPATRSTTGCRAKGPTHRACLCAETIMSSLTQAELASTHTGESTARNWQSGIGRYTNVRYVPDYPLPHSRSQAWKLLLQEPEERRRWWETIWRKLTLWMVQQGG